MQPIWCTVSIFAVAFLYYIWRTHMFLLERRQRLLRDRVTWMLWVMAEEIEACEPEPSHPCS
jgi:hypothetical protein